MRQNRALFLGALFACALLAVPCAVNAQQLRRRTMNTPRVAPSRPMRGISPTPGGTVGTSRSSGSHTMVAPNRRWNSVRVNDFHNPNHANSPANGIRNRRAENGLGFGDAPVDLQQLLNISPTNGFNWQYVNAINQDLPLKAIVDPVTRLEIAQAERLLRTGGGQFSGAYILGGGYGYYMPEDATEAAAPASTEEAEDVDQEPARDTQPRVIVLQQKADASRQESAPPTIPDQVPLMLVLHDGEKIQAIAFTVVDAKVVYITPDGVRKTIDAAQLDSAATVRLNQDNGTPLQLPSGLGAS